MKIATTLSYAGGFKESARRVSEMEKAGLDLVWVAEAYGFDGPSLMGYLAADRAGRDRIGDLADLQRGRPTLLAMTAAGLDALSDGRFHLGPGGVGTAGDRAFHGIPYEAPIGRTREIISVCRQVWAREAPLEHDGRYYRMPLAEGHGTGLGKPAQDHRSPGPAPDPVWVASLGDKNVAMTAEVADGWLPMMYIPEKAGDVWGEALKQGAAKRDPELGPLMISGGGLLAIGDSDEVIGLRDLARPTLALYIGGMGARGRNFYNDLARRYGYEKEAEEIQDLYLSGKKDEAAAAVPEEILRLTSLCGPAGFVAERVAAFREAGVTHLQVTPLPTDGQTPADLIGRLKEMTS